MGPGTWTLALGDSATGGGASGTGESGQGRHGGQHCGHPGLGVNALTRPKTWSVLTVETQGQGLSVRTPGCLRQIPASQAGGAQAFLIMKKGTCVCEGCGLTTAGGETLIYLLPTLSSQVSADPCRPLALWPGNLVLQFLASEDLELRVRDLTGRAGAGGAYFSGEIRGGPTRLCRTAQKISMQAVTPSGYHLGLVTLGSCQSGERKPRPRGRSASQ